MHTVTPYASDEEIHYFEGPCPCRADAGNSRSGIRSQSVPILDESEEEGA